MDERGAPVPLLVKRLGTLRVVLAELRTVKAICLFFWVAGAEEVPKARWLQEAEGEEAPSCYSVKAR